MEPKFICDGCGLAVEISYLGAACPECEAKFCTQCVADGNADAHVRACRD